jgi:putative endonuclease
MQKKPWILYILECSDKSLYTGITNRLSKRLEAHQAGTGARYTRGRLPVKLLYTEDCTDRSDATKRECAVKKLSKIKKLELIKGG